MGIIASVKGLYSGSSAKAAEFLKGKVSKETAKKVVSATNVPLTVLAHPIKSIVDFKAAKEQTAKQSDVSLVTQSALNAAAAAAPFSAGARGLIAKTIPSTFKGKVAAAVGVPIAYGIVTNAPEETGRTLVKAPGELAQFGSDVASFAKSPSVASAKQIVQESPIITAGLATAGVLAVGKAAAPAIGSYLYAKQLKPETTQQAISAVPTAPVGEIPRTAVEQPTSEVPFTPATQEIQEEVKPLETTAQPVVEQKKRSPRKAVKKQAIKQSVRVNVFTANNSRLLIQKYIK